MQHDDEIEKISKELEDMLKSTSEGFKEQEAEYTGKSPAVQKEESEEEELDLESLPRLRLDIAVDGMDELFENEAEYDEEIMKSVENMKEKSYDKELLREPEELKLPPMSGRLDLENNNPKLMGDCGFNREEEASEAMSAHEEEPLEEQSGNLRPKETWKSKENPNFMKQAFMNRETEEEYNRRLPEAAGETPLRRKGKKRKTVSLIKPSDGLLAAFFVPMIIMIIIFAQRGIFPFGEESFLRTDMYHQYAPFFSEFRYKLAHGGSLLYSWDIGMGVNFAALYAYYLASPLNWLIILCPQKYIIEFMTYMIVLKIGLSGLSFAWYLRGHNGTSDFGIAFFGVFYALSGYMAAYSWNIMWLDCILLFPLVILGLERLINEKKCFLYSITLGLCILSNYYISIMICIFAILYFAALLIIDIVECEKPWKEMFLSLWNFSLYSLLAGGLAAAILLPEIYALQYTASQKVKFPGVFDCYFTIFDMIARHLPGVETEIGLGHWPNIYCGVAVLMLFLLYLGCKQVQQTRKVVMCGLLLFFYASFSLNILNFVWHGFHYPNSLPCRQSFIYIFLMLGVCYEAYIHLKQIPWKNVVMAFFASIAFVLLAQKVVTDDAFQFPVFFGAIILLGIYAGIICLYQNGISKNVLVLLTLGVVSLEAAVNTAVTSITTTSRTSYIKDNEASVSLTESLMPNKSFYRVEKVTRKTKNDGAWLNFPSVSLFSSMANADLTAFFKKIGCESSTNAYSITGSTPLVDALFAVKYALYSEQPSDSEVSYLVSLEDEMYLQKNHYALPLGFMVPYDLENNWRLELTNPADVQNSLAEALGASPVLEEAPSEILGTTFSFTPEVDGDYYVFVSNKNVEKVTALLGEKSKTFDNIKRGYLLELGHLLAGEEITLRNDESQEDLVAVAYRFVPEGLEAVSGILNQNGMELTKWTDTKIQGTIEADKAGLLFLSIPYDKGWTIRVDGKAVEPYKIFDTFLSVHMTAGKHTVSLQYMPEGLKAGAMITAGSIMILLALAGCSFKYKRNRRPMRIHDNNKRE